MFFNKFCLILGVLSTWIYTATALSLTGERTLIIFDGNYLNKFYNSDVNAQDDDKLINGNSVFEENFSQFLSILNQNEYNYTLYDITSANDDDELQVIKVDEALYDNVILFPISKASLKKSTTSSKGKLLLSSKNLLSFFNEYNGNIMVVTSPNINNVESVGNFLNQFGIYPSPKNQLMLDLFQDKNDLVVSSSNLLNRYVYTVKDNKSVNFNLGKSGVAKLDNREQLVPILKASRTSFISSQNEKKSEPWVTGSQGFLIAGFQGVNNNARLTWFGTTDLLHDVSNDLNKDLIKNLVNWNFNAKSVIKALGSRHYHSLTELTYEDLNYKVNDMINYEIELTEWDGKQWIPFIANDIQFELRQVDPYYRINLTQAKTVGNETFAKYRTNDFKLPNRHGMFKFITEYNRNGLSTIKDIDIRAIRHLANDEYPRSWEITNDWVYLAANGVVIVSFILFVLLFLTTSNVTPLKKNN